jgi:hypothetical protein
MGCDGAGSSRNQARSQFRRCFAFEKGFGHLFENRMSVWSRECLDKSLITSP